MNRQELLEKVITLVPWYIEKYMTVPADYDGTKCQKITVLEEIRPINPNYMKNSVFKYSILFGIAAVVIASVAVILIDRSDKRLRDYETVMRTLNVPVLGVIPTIEPIVQKAKEAAANKTEVKK